MADPTPSVSTRVARLDSLTGLRIFAAAMVFARHVSGRGDLDNSEGTLNLLSSGLVGVSFFYIVSGFVLTWTARPGDRPREFHQRRFAPARGGECRALVPVFLS